MKVLAVLLLLVALFFQGTCQEEGTSPSMFQGTEWGFGTRDDAPVAQEPRGSMEDLMPEPSADDVAVGMVVKRGKDWRYGEQDGGPDSFGVVVEVREWFVDKKLRNARKQRDKGMLDQDTEAMPDPHFEGGGSLGGRSLRVYWRKGSGNVNVYRFGADGAYDVELVDSRIVPIDWDKVMSLVPSTEQIRSDEALNRKRKEKTLDKADRRALEALYASLNGERWRYAKKWREGAESNACQWEGVTCDEAGEHRRVFALDLAGVGL